MGKAVQHCTSLQAGRVLRPDCLRDSKKPMALLQAAVLCLALLGAFPVPTPRAFIQPVGRLLRTRPGHCWVLAVPGNAERDELSAAWGDPVPREAVVERLSDARSAGSGGPAGEKSVRSFLKRLRTRSGAVSVLPEFSRDEQLIHHDICEISRASRSRLFTVHRCFYNHRALNLCDATWQGGWRRWHCRAS